MKWFSISQTNHGEFISGPAPADYPHRYFHTYLLLSGVIAFLLFVFFRTGIIEGILVQDVTRISLIILVIFIATTLYLITWSVSLSLNHRDYLQIKKSTGIGKHKDVFKNERPVYSYYERLLTADSHSHSLETELFAEKLRGRHQIAWFATGLVIKLGLLGTVIGFVIMLQSVADLSDLDLSAIKDLMQQMTQGMGVAMNTTLMGLGCSILLSVQVLMLDRFADRLLIDCHHEFDQKASSSL